MKFVSVIQHTQSDWLGLVEDHLEGRRIRFSYFRPFLEGGGLPDASLIGDGLILLGLGPWGTAGERDLPSLGAEVSLARTCLMLGKPVIGFGMGAQILTLAADGRTRPAPLAFSTGTATRCVDDALNGYLPARFPNIVYGRDAPVPPAYAQVLAHDEAGHPALFQIGPNAFGFAGHPGIKPAMVEDLVMEGADVPEQVGERLQRLRAMRRDIEDALVPIMTGLIQKTAWMQP